MNVSSVGGISSALQQARAQAALTRKQGVATDGDGDNDGSKATKVQPQQPRATSGSIGTIIDTTA